MGMAKPMPAEMPVLVKMAVLRPMTLPKESCWVSSINYDRRGRVLEKFYLISVRHAQLVPP